MFDAWLVRNSASVGRATSTIVRSSRSSGNGGTSKRPFAPSCERGPRHNGDRERGEVLRNHPRHESAVALACTSLRSLAMPRSAMTLIDMPAACARRAASTCAAAASPFAIRFSVGSSPDSGPSRGREAGLAQLAQVGVALLEELLAMAYQDTRRSRGKEPLPDQDRPPGVPSRG